MGARVVGAEEVVLAGGLEVPAPGRRPAFGLKDRPPVFFNMELMAALLVSPPKLRLCWDQTGS